jgi:hypothetical protein
VCQIGVLCVFFKIGNPLPDSRELKNKQSEIWLLFYFGFKGEKVKNLGLDNISKECLKCHKKQKISGNFYTHRDFKESQYSDIWCIKCVKDFVKDKETLMEYADVNYREFSEDLWEWANRYTLEKLEQDEKYQNLNTTEKQDMLTKRILNEYFKSMGKTQYYRFIGSDNNVVSQPQSNQIKNEMPEETLIYSEFWDGLYSEIEIKKMNSEFEKYKDTYELNPFDETNVILIIQTYIQLQRIRKKMSKGDSGAVTEFQKLSGIYSKMSEDAQLNKKQRGLLEKGDGKSSFTQKMDDLEKLGVIPKIGCDEKDELQKLLDCNNQMLIDIFVGAGYDEQKYKKILGSNSKGVVDDGEFEAEIDSV